MDRTQTLENQIETFADQVTSLEGLVRQLVLHQTMTTVVHIPPPRSGMGTSAGTSAQVSQGTVLTVVSPAVAAVQPEVTAQKAAINFLMGASSTLFELAQGLA